MKMRIVQENKKCRNVNNYEGEQCNGMQCKLIFAVTGGWREC